MTFLRKEIQLWRMMALIFLLGFWQLLSCQGLQCYSLRHSLSTRQQQLSKISNAAALKDSIPDSDNADGSTKMYQNRTTASLHRGTLLSRRDWFGLSAATVISGTVALSRSDTAVAAAAEDITTKQSASKPKSSVPIITKANTSNGTPSYPVLAKNGTSISRSSSMPSKQPTVATTKPSQPAVAAKKKVSAAGSKELAPVNLTQVALENNMNVSMMSTDEKKLAKSIILLDRQTFTKTETKVLPHSDWILPVFRPKPQVIKKIPNSELIIASIVAGSATEIIRTALLYPLSTIKVRIQSSKEKTVVERGKEIQSFVDSFLRPIKEGGLYAGVVPALLVTVPSSGVYSGVRDVTKRMLAEAIKTPSKYDDLFVTLFGALIADVVSLIVRTPADVLTLRLQAATGDEDRKEVVGTWFKDSVKALPAVILTDLPYLLSRIALNKIVSSGEEGLGRYELETVLIACWCAALTTPFDVARTRILLDTNYYFPSTTKKKDESITPTTTTTTGLEKTSKEQHKHDGLGGEMLQHGEDMLEAVIDITQEVESAVEAGFNETSDEVLLAMVNATKENDAGLQNLFAGWFERTAYLGIGRAWLDPIRVIGYLGIRDAMLLEWFD